MSWLYGILYKGDNKRSDFNVTGKFDKVEINNLYLAIGKGKNSFYVKHKQDHIEAFVGVPIIDNESGKMILNEESFKKSLQKITSKNHFKKSLQKITSKNHFKKSL